MTISTAMQIPLSIFFLNFLIIFFPKVETKPHHVNFFMKSKTLDRSPQIQERLIRHSSMTSESLLHQVSEGETNFQFTWKDFPEGK